jgi:hypothetical protein
MFCAAVILAGLLHQKGFTYAAAANYGNHFGAIGVQRFHQYFLFGFPAY